MIPTYPRVLVGSLPVIPANYPVLAGSLPVIPAEAGIHPAAVGSTYPGDRSRPKTFECAP